MKTLLIGIALLVLVGIAGFLYRGALEHGGGPITGATGCTLEAKICPDGTSVGRSGPGCTFAACPAGNIEDADDGISYALPEGYVVDENAYGADPTFVAAFVKSVASTSPDTIMVRAYPIPDSETATQVMIENTKLEPSDMNPKGANAFTPKVIGTHTFESIVTERFEGTISSAFFYPRTNDVLEFDIVETGVNNWTDANLNVDALPEHQAFLKMLTTLQINDSK